MPVKQLLAGIAFCFLTVPVFGFVLQMDENSQGEIVVEHWDASRISAHDIEGLRAAGFSDVQISDIALCAAFRCFVARFYDATGAGPEPAFLNGDGDFRDALAIGRKL